MQRTLFWLIALSLPLLLFLLLEHHLLQQYKLVVGHVLQHQDQQRYVFNILFQI